MSQPDPSQEHSQTQPVLPYTQPTTDMPAPSGQGTPWLWIGGAFFLLAIMMLALGFVGGRATGDEEVRRETIVIQSANLDTARSTQLAQSNAVSTENANLRTQLENAELAIATQDASLNSLGDRWNNSAGTISALETRAADPSGAAPENIISTIGALQATNSALQATVDAISGSQSSSTESTQSVTEEATATETPVLLTGLAPGETRIDDETEIAFLYTVTLPDGFVGADIAPNCGRISGQIIVSGNAEQTFIVQWRHAPANRSGSITTIGTPGGPGSFAIEVPETEVNGVYTVELLGLNNSPLAPALEIRFPEGCAGTELRVVYVSAAG